MVFICGTYSTILGCEWLPSSFYNILSGGVGMHGEFQDTLQTILTVVKRKATKLLLYSNLFGRKNVLKTM